MAPAISGLTKTPKRPRNTNQLAKLIVNIATGEQEDTPTDREKTGGGVGSQSGLKGVAARAKKLTDKERSEIAMKAANARWKDQN